MIILGIETSCDETAAAVIEGRGDEVRVLSNVVSSQIEIHKKYGGVVPEVAAREHVLNILPVIDEAIRKAGVKSPYPPLLKGANIKGAGKVDAIAVTAGPGLVTSLLVGVETAKTLGYIWNLPVVALNHIEGHIYANWLRPISGNSKSEILNSKQIQNLPVRPVRSAGGQSDSKIQISKIKFPAVILTVSGGHTMLVLMSGHGKYRVLGETRDDAAGEAFDKAAQLLDLGYPGGPAIAAVADKFNKVAIPLHPPTTGAGQALSRGQKKLPRPMINSGDFDFSFSGLKTALFYQLERDRNWRKKISAYAAEFQNAAVEVLVHKTIKAAQKFNCRNVMLSGGVAANLELRNRLKIAVKEKLTGAELIIPDLKYCTDNAAMIAAAGYFRARKKDFTPWQKLKTEPNIEFR